MLPFCASAAPLKRSNVMRLSEVSVSANASLHVSIGKIVVNLEALEFTLRLFLYESVGPQDSSLEFQTISVGDRVPENPLTSYDQLSELIRKVNARLSELGSAHRVDGSVVAIRDAIAHGRAVSLDPNATYRLIKFSRPRDGFVCVETATELTPRWLDEQARRAYEEGEELRSVARSLGLQCFPKE